MAEMIDPAHNTTPEMTAQIVKDKLARKGQAAVAKNTRALERLTVQYVDINSVGPNTYNPNRQDEQTLELLCMSIKEDGFTQPIIVQRSSNQIVDGEHRWRAARKMGMTQIPIVYVDMTDEQMRVATLRHNRARGSEDSALAVEVLRDLQKLGAADWAQSSLQLSDTEMNALLLEEPAHEALASEEFGDAWVPERGDPLANDTKKDGKSTTKMVTQRESGGTQALAMSKAAAAAADDREKKIRSAKSEAERTAVATQLEIPYHLRYTFTDEQAKLVKALLGEEKTADRLVELCREIKAAGGVDAWLAA